VKLALAAALAALAVALAAGAPAGTKECEAAGKVCLGTLPSSRARVVLASLNGSAERGVAVVTFGFHETRAVVRLRGAPAGSRQAVRILKGGCRGKLHLKLGTVVGGRGVVRGQEIAHLSGLALAIHATADPTSPVVACGRVPPVN
jgi:hypothetical protein